MKTLVYLGFCLMQTACMSSAGPPPGPASGGLPGTSPVPGTPETEALRKRLAALEDARGGKAQAELAELSRSQAVNQDWRQQALLIRAFGHQRPLLPDSVKYLDAQSQPKSLNLQIVIIALVENQSAPALELLGRKLADGSIDKSNRISWIRYQILPRRRSASMLRGVEKWLSDGKLDAAMRDALADAIFDYRPREWGGEDLPSPPDDSATKADAAEILHRIGKVVLSSKYPASVQTAVNRTLAKIP